MAAVLRAGDYQEGVLNDGNGERKRAGGGGAGCVTPTPRRSALELVIPGGSVRD